MESVYRQKMPVLTTLWVELRRDNGNINYLNPASYTALDTARLYFQFGVTGEYAHLSTYKENASYRVAQNTAFNIAFRLHKNMYMSLGFTEKSDIG